MTNSTKGYVAAAVVVVVVVVGGLVVMRRAGKPVVVAPAVVQTAPAVVPPVAAPVVADCQAPGMPPPPPDGDTADAAEMKAGHDRIQAFVVALEAYQTCRNNQSDHAGPAVTAAQKQAWVDEGNGAVDEANDLADRFSVQLKRFKAKHPDE